jgi:putative aminopeptidase FrvX
VSVPASTLLIDIPAERRETHQRWLMELTQLPTAAGLEDRVSGWVRSWLEQRPELSLARDLHGNLTLALRNAPASEYPLYFTAHMDHPAFVVESVSGDAVTLSFRGGVMADYFHQAPVEACPVDGERVLGVLLDALEAKANGFPAYSARFEGSVPPVGTIVRWALPRAEILTTDGVECLYTDACDDLAALAGALAAFDELRLRQLAGETIGDVRVLLTRAEEIGFIGAIGACREGTIPRGARVIALENSRSFADSPIGAGPIVRVGDRISVFTPQVTADVARVAEEIGGPALPKASEKQISAAWRWQRKLMAGGACEASVFCAFGHASTCVCLPLGNYHNMGDLDAVQAGSFAGQPRAAREYIALSDYEGLVDLLVGCGLRLTDAAGGEAKGATPTFRERLDGLWASQSFVLGG